MLGTIDIILLLITATIGAIFGAALSWGESGDPFTARKFLVSLGKGMIAALVFALGYQTVETLNWFDFIAIFIGCAGFDALLKRGQDSARRAMRS